MKITLVVLTCAVLVAGVACAPDRATDGNNEEGVEPFKPAMQGGPIPFGRNMESSNHRKEVDKPIEYNGGNQYGYRPTSTANRDPLFGQGGILDAGYRGAPYTVSLHVISRPE